MSCISNIQSENKCEFHSSTLFTGEEVAFDIQDALGKLTDEGVVKTRPARVGTERFEYKAKDIQQAIL